MNRLTQALRHALQEEDAGSGSVEDTDVIINKVAAVIDAAEEVALQWQEGNDPNDLIESVRKLQQLMLVRARVFGPGVDQRVVATYLPANYEVTGWGSDVDEGPYVLIEGQDSAGWTFDDYVSPRLASGCYTAKVIV